MGVKNLLSLLNGKWFIEANYRNSMLPLLYAVLHNPNTKVSEQTFDDLNKNYFAFYDSNKIKVKGNSPFKYFTDTIEKALDDADAKKSKDSFVAIISIKNPIYKYSQNCAYGTKDYQKQMTNFAQYPNCTGVVLDIDSGGGQVAGTAEFYDFIKSFEKPVVAYTDGMMCSAAYYIGSASNHIIANKRCDAIGSIGTMISFVDFRGYYEKQGAKVITAYATKSTNKNKNFEDLLAGKPENYIKNVLDPITEDFHKDMKSARSKLKEDVLSGATYKADKALELGLIDEIGNLSTAINKVIELAENADNTTKNKNMANLNVPLIEAVLGEQFSDAENETGLLLTDEQAQLIEQTLAENNNTAKKLTTTENQLNTANSRIEAVETALETALKTAEVKNASEMDAVAGIEALSELVVEYGAKQAKRPTTPITSTESPLEDVVEVDGINIEGAMNN